MPFNHFDRQLLKAATIMPISTSTALSLLALLVSFPETSSVAGDAVVQKFGDWTVTIQPGPRGSGIRDWTASPERTEIQLVSHVQAAEADAAAVPPAPAKAETVAPVADSDDLPTVNAPCATGNPTCDPLAMVKLYSRVYDQIPFSRAEYTANPSYRHDATMEFLFGKMRPMVVHRGAGSRSYAPAVMPAYSPMYSGYGFNSSLYLFYIGTASDPHYGWLQPASLW